MGVSIHRATALDFKSIISVNGLLSVDIQIDSVVSHYFCDVSSKQGTASLNIFKMHDLPNQEHTVTVSLQDSNTTFVFDYALIYTDPDQSLISHGLFRSHREVGAVAGLSTGTFIFGIILSVGIFLWIRHRRTRSAREGAFTSHEILLYLTNSASLWQC